MGWEAVAGDWRVMRGKVREQWGKLTDDDLDRIAGRREQLVGTLQQRYGKTREVLDREVRDFEQRITGDLAGNSGATTTERETGGGGSGARNYGVSGGATGTGVSGAGIVPAGMGTGSARSSEEARMGGRRGGDEGRPRDGGDSGSRGSAGRRDVGGEERGGEIERTSYSGKADDEHRG